MTDQMLRYLGAVIGSWAVVSLVTNALFDRVWCVPADSSPNWPAYVLANPRRAGVVSFFRGYGLDMLKTVHATLLVLTAKPEHDPSARDPANDPSCRPPPMSGAN